MNEENVPCGCGRSATGFCTGLHEMSEEEYEEYLLQGLHDLEEGSE